MSYKCADLNKLVPDMMGVSQAVLESVIFVHQEESCWPLAEDKVCVYTGGRGRDLVCMCVAKERGSGGILRFSVSPASLMAPFRPSPLCITFSRSPPAPRPPCPPNV